MKPKSSVLRTAMNPAIASVIGSWFAARSGRERGLILCLGALAAICGLWYGVGSPLLEIREAAHARLIAASEASASLEARAQATETSNLTALQGPISDVMATRAAAFGITLTQIEAGGSDDTASAIVTSDRYDAVMPFVAALERVDGAQILSLRLVQAGKPGLVRLQIRVRRS